MASNPNTIYNNVLLFQSKQELNNNTSKTKIFPELLLSKNNFKSEKQKNKSKYSFNSIKKYNNYNLGNKFSQIKLMKNSRSQKLIIGNFRILNNSRKPNNNLTEKIDKNFEKILLKKIDEVNKSLEDSENIFRYNQKILKKKLDEKNTEVNLLKKELENEKIQKQSLYEDIYDKNKSEFIDSITELQKQIEKLSNLNTELTEQNLEYEKKIKFLEKKDSENKLKIKNMSQKYNLLITEKTNNILEKEIKQYINDLNIQIDQNQNELNTLHEDMSYLTQENKRLKFLAREIIEARNETEIFFLDALNEAKKEMYKDRKEKMYRNYFFPKLKTFYDNNNNENIKVDIRELTPDMREKILRNLFEKINRGYNEQNYRELNYIMNKDISDIKD